MFRRWFIRSLFLLLVAAALAAWAWSLAGPFSISYGTTTSIASVNSVAGQLLVSRWSDSGANNAVVGWLTGLQMNNSNSGDQSGEAFDGEFDSAALIGRCGGFALWRSADAASAHFVAMAIPWWFINLVAVLLGLYAWTKTRPKPNPATAFPMEIKP